MYLINGEEVNKKSAEEACEYYVRHLHPSTKAGDLLHITKDNDDAYEVMVKADSFIAVEE